MNRRQFLRTAGGATAAAGAVAASGTAAAQSQQPDFGGWLGGVDGGYTDARGESEVTVEVGASGNGGSLAFSPAGLWVDPGTTVIFEWTGEGGDHNVVAQEGPAALDSGGAVGEAGYTYEYTFEEGGITNYACAPHQSLGMVGAVAVGGDVPTVSTGGGGEADPKHMGVAIQAHYVGIATILAILVSIMFTFFQLKYGESPNASGGT
ncbi:halocyanin domain-containing protein [Halosegnis longus]|uniref:halocyanin domain-containing protein n=1 Tax=Halosegnis longus TaxID=2216012 RepID=UPI00096AC568|nr:halocyanin domain-containing protein [Salella cibi]